MQRHTLTLVKELTVRRDGLISLLVCHRSLFLFADIATPHSVPSGQRSEITNLQCQNYRDGFLRFLFIEFKAFLAHESKKDGAKCNFFLKMFGSYKKLAIFAPNYML